MNVFLKIFDAQVQPTVLYGAEIWGLESCSSVTDTVRLFGLKRYLGVDRRTPSEHSLNIQKGRGGGGGHSLNIQEKAVHSLNMHT